jgi:hypothetical protein
MSSASLHFTALCCINGVVLSLGSAPSPLELVVDGSDSSYVVSVGGKPWLHSGALRFFVNGEWHGTSTTTKPPPVPTCGSGKPHTDIKTGDDYMQLLNATAASCCAACITHRRACNGWVLTTVAEEKTNIPANTCFLIENGRGYTPSSSGTGSRTGTVHLFC